MKIGIITWWRLNYGSVLQTVALQQELKKIGCDKYEVICQYGKKTISFDNLVDKIKTVGIIESAKRAFWKTAFRGLKKRNKRIQNYIDANIFVSEQNYSEDTIVNSDNYYDVFICGSDQIWNLEFVSTDSMYWLGFAKKGKKIAYAPSFGTKELNNIQERKVAENLRTFKAISCREKSGTEKINRIIGSNKCHTVLDPTLLIERAFWDRISEKSYYSDEYIFAYFLRGTKKQRKLVEKFAKEKNLKIVSIPFLDYNRIELYDMFFSDYKFWDADPVDFISLIRHAKFVFCDSFHAMVFSILYHREFFVFPKIEKNKQVDNSQISRMTDLLNTLKISDRLLINDVFPEKISNINWQEVDDVISNERLKSEKYLINAIFG